MARREEMRWVEEEMPRSIIRRTAKSWGTTAALFSAAVPIVLGGIFYYLVTEWILFVLWMLAVLLAGAVGYVVGYVAGYIVAKVRHRRIQSALTH